METHHVERGSSAVECRTRNQVSPGSNPPLLPFRRLGIFVLSIDAPSWLSCTHEYLAIDSGGHASDLVVARNCCMTRILPGEAELVSEWTGLPGRVKRVKRFERSNGLDIALYKDYLYILPLRTQAQPEVPVRYSLYINSSACKIKTPHHIIKDQMS